MMDREVLVRNAMTSGVFGGMLGVANTIVIISVFTMVSTNQFMNFYMGGFFMIIGVMVLFRVWKRQNMTSIDLGLPG